jgi:hypothetical protein
MGKTAAQAVTLVFGSFVGCIMVGGMFASAKTGGAGVFLGMGLGSVLGFCIAALAIMWDNER